MASLLERFRRPLWDDSANLFVGQIAAYAAAIAVMCLGYRRLGTLGLDGGQIFFGVMLVSLVGLALVIIGLLLKVLAAARTLSK